MKTAKERLIDMLFEHCQNDVTKDVIKRGFELVYNRDRILSKRGGYTPSELQEAEQELEDFTKPFGRDSWAMQDVLSHILTNLKFSNEIRELFGRLNSGEWKKLKFLKETEINFF